MGPNVPSSCSPESTQHYIQSHEPLVLKKILEQIANLYRESQIDSSLQRLSY